MFAKLTVRVGWLVVANLLIGFDRLLEGPSRTSSPGFAVAKRVMPLHWWGVMFIAFGILLWLAQQHIRRMALRLTVVFVGFVGWFFWAACSFLSAQQNHTSFGGVILYGLIFSVHVIVAIRGE